MRQGFGTARGLRAGAMVAMLACACTPSEPDGAGAAAGSDDAAGSDAAVEADAGGGPELVPTGPRLARLTRAQFRNTVRDLFGPDVVPPAGLEPDTAADGLFAVGATVAAVSSRGVEQYFDAARSLAAQLTTPERLGDTLPCTPVGPDDGACLSQTVQRWGRRIWRRPLASDELERVVAIGAKAATQLGGFARGVEVALALLLQSPHFIYRPTIGEPDPAVPGGRRYTAWEMASRLSFFLWNTTPDETLLDAAQAGELATDGGLATQVDRLLGSERAREGVRSFFAEWLDLTELDDLGKDPTVFKHYSADLGPAAREETLRMVEHLIFDENADYRMLFLTRTTFVNGRLAAIYNVPAPVGDGFGRIELPADGARIGLLGQVSFLALHAHPVASSATKRGLFVRERLLCQTLPSPPTELNTAIPEPSPDAKTLRDRLIVHMENPSCAGCHVMMDPVGFGLENFDGVGRYRVLDNGGIIDPTGELDGTAFETPVELAEAVANHPSLVPCLVQSLRSYATGHAPEPGELAEVRALTEAFVADGHRVRGLLRAIALSPGFRRVGEVD